MENNKKDSIVEYYLHLIGSIITIVGFILSLSLWSKCHQSEKLGNTSNALVINSPKEPKPISQIDERPNFTTEKKTIKIEKGKSNRVISQINNNVDNKSYPIESLEVKYVSGKFGNSNNTKRLIVDITYNNENIDGTICSMICRVASEKGYNSKSSFFTNAYYKDGIEQELKAGNLDYIDKLKLNTYADYLLVGNYTITYGKDCPSDPVSGYCDYSFSLVDLKSGNVVSPFPEISFLKCGQSNQDIKDKVFESLNKIVKQVNF